MKERLMLIIAYFFSIQSGISQITVSPTGVNVNASGSTTAFFTFGRVINKIPVEAIWCGELIDASPDIGFKPDPNTIFGRLPIRYDLSKIDANGTFTDIMSIPPSVARRAYQAAQAGAESRFFYVRRFVSLVGGRDEFVVVTCRLTGGGARVPFALQDVKITGQDDAPVFFVKKGGALPQVVAEIYYNGSGQLKGRWEVMLPGDEPPTVNDLLTEATLPIEQRGLQRRYTELRRFNVFLPPTGKFILPGPDSKKIPVAVEGLYMLLLRIEATDDKEGDSDLAAVGTGGGVVHSGAVAGFPIPPFRYYVGSAENELTITKEDAVQLLQPGENATISPDKPIDFNWLEQQQGALYRLEVENSQNQSVLSALLPPGVGSYRAPSWLKDKVPDQELHWRIVVIDFAGNEIGKSARRQFKIGVFSE